jgi:hypothetical protein
MSITTIARQAQGMRAGQVISKLAEDAYFMRDDNKVTQPPPARTVTTKAQVAARTSAVTVLEASCRPSQPYSCKRRWTLSSWQQRRSCWRRS